MSTRSPTRLSVLLLAQKPLHHRRQRQLFEFLTRNPLCTFRFAADGDTKAIQRDAVFGDGVLDGAPKLGVLRGDGQFVF